MKRCSFDPTRIERCLVCKEKCNGFMEWYAVNKQRYMDLIEWYITTYPDKYEKETIIMAKAPAKANTNTPPPPTGKMVAVVKETSDGTNVIEFVTSMEKLKTTEPDKISGKRLVGLTGKEYIAIMSITIKEKQLGTFK